MERRQGKARMRGKEETRQRSGDAESGEEGEEGGIVHLSRPVSHCSGGHHRVLPVASLRLLWGVSPLLLVGVASSRLLHMVIVIPFMSILPRSAWHVLRR